MDGTVESEIVRTVTIAGSTGSIGTQALDIVRAHPQRFKVRALAASGATDKSRAQLLAQIIEFRPDVVAVTDETAVELLRSGLPTGIAIPEFLVGTDALGSVCAERVDVVLNALAGAVGLPSTMAALVAGNTVALANKESLVIGGTLVTALAQPGQLVPVDSEHSALAQCLRAGTEHEVSRLVLTASGGAFRTSTEEELAHVTVSQALTHPNWDMGPLVTINSATMVNKGLEVIEAHLLFAVPYDRIDVVIHPQQVIHSMVEFCDGSTIAQASPPDMHLPIALGLSWPQRLPDISPRIDWTTAAQWDFYPLDDTRFPAVALARAVGVAGGTYPAVFNASNEVAVAGFINGVIGFRDIVAIVNETVSAHSGGSVQSAADVLAADEWARHHAQELLAVHSA
jgi:1-deoxy-D-xylulose-5-phosphate reductoisomerase